MPIGQAFLGASVGVLARAWANKLSKQRMLARPWNHVACVLVFGAAGWYHQDFQDYLLETVNRERAVRGLPIVQRESYGIFGSSQETDWLVTGRQVTGPVEHKEEDRKFMYNPKKPDSPAGGAAAMAPYTTK